MDQGAIAAFKAYYLRRTVSQLICDTDGKDSQPTRGFGQSFNIMEAIENIAEAWREVTDHCMNGAWMKVWPECIKDFMGFEPELPTLHNGIAEMANEVGFP